MRFKTIFAGIIIAASLSSSSFAANKSAEMGQYTQVIQVVNLLANTNLPDPGMTTTAIMLKFYNNDVYPCWTIYRLDYKDDVTIHAGPTQGCINKVYRVSVTPILVADKLKTYEGPINIDVDTSKYSTNITLSQLNPPVFDSQSGLITSSGVIQPQIQASLYP